eukprot:scaffold47969_cov55-Attheya_sp.AAC.2
MAEKLDDMGFKSSYADPDVWLRLATKANGEECYEYVLMYVDDILVLSIDPRAILEWTYKPVSSLRTIRSIHHLVI